MNVRKQPVNNRCSSHQPRGLAHKACTLMPLLLVWEQEVAPSVGAQENFLHAPSHELSQVHQTAFWPDGHVAVADFANFPEFTTVPATFVSTQVILAFTLCPSLFAFCKINKWGTQISCCVATSCLPDSPSSLSLSQNTYTTPTAFTLLASLQTRTQAMHCRLLSR